MKFLLAFHISVSAIVFGLLQAIGAPAKATAFIVGSALSLGNIILLYVSWKRILEKKLVALSIGVIVIKYATLGFIIYRIASRNLFQLEWVSVGLGVVILSALATAVHVSRQESRNETRAEVTSQEKA